MEIPEILDELDWFTGDFPRAALEEAIERKDEITPELLTVLDDTIDNVEELDAEGGYMAHIYAMFLLAQFREVRAYPLVIRFALLPGERIDSMCGDFLTEDFATILASVSGGDARGIQALIENENAFEWVRAVAFNALVTLVAENQLDRDAAIRYLAELFRGKLKREPSEVWNSLVAAASDLYPEELMEDIRQAYDDGLVDPGNIGLDDVQRDLARGKNPVLKRLADDPNHRMIEDTISEMEWWACFHEDEPDQEDELDHQKNPFEGALNEPDSEPMPYTVTSPIRRTEPKIGRNEPCPCGSGKKYKKCCGN